MTGRRAFDLSVYFIADPAVAGQCDLAALTRAAVDGGATIVQLRDKTGSTRSFIDRALILRELLRPLGVPLIINDRVDVALAVEADGVHLGQDDMPAAKARRLLGSGFLLGLSVSSPAEAAEADPRIVDYVGLGPVYRTTSKADAKGLLGLDRLRSLRALVPVPVVAISGIDPGNAEGVIRAGADGVAVVSAICAAKDPRHAAAALSAAVKAGLAGRAGTPGIAAP